MLYIILYYIITRTKTSIRYAKDDDREKREIRREREKGRRRDIEREGKRYREGVEEIRKRERDVRDIELERE